METARRLDPDAAALFRMKIDPITLPDDIPAALDQVAGYLREIKRNGDRAVWTDFDGWQRPGPKGAANWQLSGYWQTPEYLEGLEDIWRECLRLKAVHVKQQRDYRRGAWRWHFLSAFIAVIIYAALTHAFR